MMETHRKVQVAVIGAGTAGLAAMTQVRRVTDNFVLINGGALGTTCARVGCMPSKAVIQVAEDFHRRKVFDRVGIVSKQHLTVDIPNVLEHVRDLRDIFVDRVLAGTTDELGEQFIDGYARFAGPNLLQVSGHRVQADNIVIATGSRPVVPDAWRRFGDRVLTTDNLFEQDDLPDSVAVLGLGVIGLELGQALGRIGVEVTGIDALQRVGGITDPAVNKIAVDLMGREFPVWLGHRAELQEESRRLRVSSGEQTVVVDKVLVCLGRRPNLDRLGLEQLGVETDARGVPKHDPHTMQIDGMPIFIAGDVNADRQILHEAADEGRIAGRNAVSKEIQSYARRTPITITFTDPNIASVGVPFTDLDESQLAVGEIRFGPVGRAVLMAKNKGLLRVYAQRRNGKLLGGSMIAPSGEHLAHLLAWSVQLGQSVHDVLRMPFYHPAIEEALQAALQDLKRKIDPSTRDTFELERLDVQPRP